MLTLIIISFLAGVLTVLAPCILPVLPIVIGGSVSPGEKPNKLRPYIITGSLAIAIVLFTLILKASTAFIAIPPDFWKWLSGSIIIFFGVISLFPDLWSKVSTKLGLGRKSEEALQRSSQKKGVWRDVLVGLSLGPVFSSCSPTYFLILATVLPASFATGLVALMAYAAGLSLILLLIALLGQKLIAKIRWAADPKGWFKRGLGILFIVVGVFIISGVDKQIESAILDAGYFDVTKVEELLLDRVE